MRIAIAEEDGAVHQALRGGQAFEADELIGISGLRDLGSALADPTLRVLIFRWDNPWLSGPELCRRIRLRGASTYYLHLIAVVGRHADSERLEAYRAGADAVLDWPCTREEAEARVGVARRIVHHEEALRERSDELERMRFELELRNAALSEIASSDALTGLRNRRFFREALDAQFSLARRKGLPISLVMLDVDQFKSFNDEFGHPAGDEVLREVGRLLWSTVRDHDIVARYGGEEFAILLPATEADESSSLVDRLRATISGHPWPLRPITISLGVATLGPHEAEPSDLVDQADRALYFSKALGRDRATHSRDLVDLGPGSLPPRLVVSPLISPHLTSP